MDVIDNIVIHNIEDPVNYGYRVQLKVRSSFTERIRQYNGKCEILLDENKDENKRDLTMMLLVCQIGIL